jgi:hypothetical protein
MPRFAVDHHLQLKFALSYEREMLVALYNRDWEAYRDWEKKFDRARTQMREQRAPQ